MSVNVRELALLVSVSARNKAELWDLRNPRQNPKEVLKSPLRQPGGQVEFDAALRPRVKGMASGAMASVESCGWAWEGFKGFRVWGLQIKDS